MAIDPVWLMIEQLKRVCESQGWKMTNADTSGDKVKVIFEKDKPKQS